MNSRPIVNALLRKYGKEKWILSPKEVWSKHDNLNSFDKKFQVKASEDKLASSGSNLWFGLKSGIIFDREEFLLIGDAMDHLHFNYEVSGSIKEVFLGFEGYTLYYKNGDHKKKMTLSHGEVRFFKEYIITCESQNRPWDWEPITDM